LKKNLGAENLIFYNLNKYIRLTIRIVHARSKIFYLPVVGKKKRRHHQSQTPSGASGPRKIYWIDKEEGGWRIPATSSTPAPTALLKAPLWATFRAHAPGADHFGPTPGESFVGRKELCGCKVRTLIDWSTGGPRIEMSGLFFQITFILHKPLHKPFFK